MALDAFTLTPGIAVEVLPIPGSFCQRLAFPGAGSMVITSGAVFKNNLLLESTIGACLVKIDGGTNGVYLRYPLDASAWVKLKHLRLVHDRFCKDAQRSNIIRTIARLSNNQAVQQQHLHPVPGVSRYSSFKHGGCELCHQESTVSMRQSPMRAGLRYYTDEVGTACPRQQVAVLNYGCVVEAALSYYPDCAVQLSCKDRHKVLTAVRPYASHFCVKAENSSARSSR